MSRRLEPFLSTVTFRFDAYRTSFTGSMQVILPSPGNCIPIQVQVVKEELTILVGLDVMDSNCQRPIIAQHVQKSLWGTENPFSRGCLATSTCAGSLFSFHPFTPADNEKYCTNTRCVRHPEIYTSCYGDQHQGRYPHILAKPARFFECL